MRLGLDLSDVHARAVVVDDDGRVVARGAHALTGARWPLPPPKPCAQPWPAPVLR